MIIGIVGYVEANFKPNQFRGTVRNKMGRGDGPSVTHEIASPNPPPVGV